MYIGVVFVAFPVAVLSANLQDLLERQVNKQKIENQDLKYIEEAKDEKEREERIQTLQHFYDSLNRNSSIFITTPTNERFVVNKEITDPLKSITKVFSLKKERSYRHNHHHHFHQQNSDRSSILSNNSDPNVIDRGSNTIDRGSNTIDRSSELPRIEEGDDHNDWSSAAAAATHSRPTTGTQQPPLTTGGTDQRKDNSIMIGTCRIAGVALFNESLIS
jgi:hypothetical protein